MCDLRTCSRKKFVPKSVWFTVQVITSWYTIVKNSIVRWVISHIHQSARGQLATIDSLQQERGKDNSVQPHFQSAPRRSQESLADSMKGRQCSLWATRVETCKNSRLHATWYQHKIKPKHKGKDQPNSTNKDRISVASYGSRPAG